MPKYHIFDQIRTLGRFIHPLCRESRTSLKFEFYVSLNFYGFANDGGTIIYPENSARLEFELLYDKYRIFWVNRKMTGNHQSCWFDGWDRPIISTISDAYDNLIPPGYEDHPQKSSAPIHDFIHPWMRFMTPVEISHTNADRDGYRRIVESVTSINP